MPNADHYNRERYVAQPGQQRGMSVSQQRYQQARNAKPINPRILLALGVVAIALLAVIVIRFIAFSGTASQYGAVKSQIDQNNAQITQLEESAAQSQAEIDSMQPEIEKYNASGKK